VSSITHAATTDNASRGGGSSLPPAKIALWFFMGVVTTLFFLLTIAFLARSVSSDWQSLGESSQPLANPWQLWVNTALLLASSVTFEFALISARRNNSWRTKIGLELAGLFAVAFLLGQLLFWHQLGDAGYFLSSNPANSFFYLITAIHGLHLLGGLVAWGRVTLKAWRGVAIERLRLGVELTARYWHFLFVIWLAMFALLASPPSITAALARLCGMR